MTTQPARFRNPDILQVLPEREWVWEHLPKGHEGFVAEDLDLVVRTYGARYGLDSLGRFRLIELKHGNARLGVSKVKTFGPIDAGLKTGITASRYDGYYVVRTNGGWDGAGMFNVNGVDLSHAQFVEWMQRADTATVRPYDFGLDLR